MKSSIKSNCKKTVLSVILCLAATVPLFAASMKDYVCIVSRNVSDDSKKFLEEYRDSIKSKGYTSYANRIDSYLNGSFGSGFIYYGPDKKPYVVTNRHVVSNALTADVKFEKEDGEYDEYKQLPIVAVDDVLDVAVIALPAGFNRTGLVFRVNPLTEGDDVWSAGFPALGDKAMWQFGKGIVTNPTARIKELLDPNVSTIIQHSAEIDSGNSGGPLLMKNANYAAGYAVVGINTWKAFYRQNTNFAIPAKVIKNYIDTSLTNKNTSQDITSRLVAFSKALKNSDQNYRDLSFFVSNDMLSLASGDAFINVLKKAPTEIRSEIVYIFIEDPLEGLKCSIAYDIWNKMHNDDVADFSVASSEKTDSGYNVKFNVAEDTVESTWVMSQGAWRLKEFGDYKAADSKADKTASKDKQKASGEKAKSNKKSGVEISNPYLFTITGGPAFPTNGQKTGFDISALYMNNDYFGFGLFIHNEPIAVKYSSTWSSNYGKIEYKNTTMFGFDLRVSVPLNFNFIIVEPKADARLGMIFAANKDTTDQTETEMFYLGIGGGVDVTFAFSRSFAIVCGVEYLYSFYKQEKIGDVIASVGLKFVER